MWQIDELQFSSFIIVHLLATSSTPTIPSRCTTSHFPTTQMTGKKAELELKLKMENGI